MKKNKWMRIASVLLVLCLVTTCTVSGTYAKYITTDSAKDTARVAKFGVVASITGDLFGPTYVGNDTDHANHKIVSWADDTETVSSVDGTDVIAPGTTGNTLTFAVNGIPEVSTATALTRSYDADGVDAERYSAEPVLKAGEYGVMVKFTGILTNESVQGLYTTDDNEVFTPVAAGDEYDDTLDYFKLVDCTGAGTFGAVAADYYPLIWWTDYGTDALSGTAVPNNRLADAYEELKDGLDGQAFVPNEDNALVATLTWDWFFEGDFGDDEEGAVETDSIFSIKDKADTILGDMIAVDANGKLTGDEYVVVSDGTDYKTVLTKTVPVNDDAVNEVLVAYQCDGIEPDYAYDGDVLEGAAESDGVLAILGVAFDVSLTVTQVD